MKPFPSLSMLVLSLALTPSAAHADVYKCKDENGKVSYTNTRNKGCQPLGNDASVSTVSLRSRQPAMSSGSGTTEASASFPRVSTGTQRERDLTRRQVLEGELNTEQSALIEARQALAQQEAVRNGNEQNYQKVLERLQPYKAEVERRERNVEAISKEISGLR